MTPQELTNALEQFTGTEQWHRFSVLFPKVVLTDGVKFLAEEAKCYWLLDVIASHLPSVPKDEGFCVATLKKYSSPGFENKAWFHLQDDLPATNNYATQLIEHTDFPLDEIKLYVIRQDDLWVILLPSEY